MNRLPKLVILESATMVSGDAAATGIAIADDWAAMPGSLEAIARLNHAGVTVAIVSSHILNSSDAVSWDEVNRGHARFHHALARCGGHVDGIFFCPHGPDERCECRLPAPGLLRSISLRFNVPLQGVIFFCRSEDGRDAAVAARAIPVVIGSGDPFQDLSGAVDWLFSGSPVA